MERLLLSGDGACFTADVDTCKLQPPPDLLAKIMPAAITAWTFNELTDGTAGTHYRKVTVEDLAAAWVPEPYISIVKHSGNYSHSGMIYASLRCDYGDRAFGIPMPEDLQTEISTWLDGLESEWQERARSLSDELYSDLDAAHDAEMSDATLYDILSDSDDLFNADGDEWENWMAEEEEEEEPELIAA